MLLVLKLLMMVIKNPVLIYYTVTVIMHRTPKYVLRYLTYISF